MHSFLNAALVTSQPPFKPLTQASNDKQIANQGISGTRSTDSRSDSPTIGVASLLDPAEIIAGTDAPGAPRADLSLDQRRRLVQNYTHRIKTQINNIETGSEGERNVRYQHLKPFLTPAGYFSGALLAAGCDPHQKVTVTLKTYTGMGKPEHLSSAEKRTYFAWELAAGALEHDRVERGGPVNFSFLHIEPADEEHVEALESLGKVLQASWEADVAKPMRDESGTRAQRAGKADAYALQSILNSLMSDKAQGGNLSAEAKEAVRRTVQENGQVIVPNIYGYPLSGYAFIAYTPYEGNFEHRPNKGLMIDLEHGKAHEIQGDDDFAQWAKQNRDDLNRSFNARDKQGGIDVHWPRASDVLDTLIAGGGATYEGYKSLVADQAIPVRELFNYTRARRSDYRLKFGRLKGNNGKGVASRFQAVNANNARWADQTEVFGSSQQSWKEAKDFWGNTFGYVPLVGNTGNIVFGIHDGIYGKTASDRVQGNAVAVISGLQLIHEVAQGMTDANVALQEGLERYSVGKHYRWDYDAQTKDLQFVSTPVVMNAEKLEPPAQYPGMREIMFRGRKYFAAEQPDMADGLSYHLRIPDPKDPAKLVSGAIVANPDEAGAWRRTGVEGGGRGEAAGKLETSTVFRGIHEHTATRAISYMAEVDGYWKSVEFDLQHNTWRLASTHRLLKWEEGKGFKYAQPEAFAGVTDEQRLASLKQFGIEELPTLPRIEAAAGQVEIPKQIHQIWMGDAEKLMERAKVIEKNAALAKEQAGFSTTVHVLLDGMHANEQLAVLKEAMPSATIIDMRQEPFFIEFQKTKFHEPFALLAREGSDRNLSAASDILRYPMMEHFGGIYLDTDDELLPGFGTSVYKVAPGDLLLNDVVNEPMLGMKLDFNSSNFGTLKGNPLLKKIQEEGWARYQQNPDLFKDRPHGAITEAQIDDMTQYMTEESRVFGPGLLNDVVRKEHPKYQRYISAFSSINDIAEKGVVLSVEPVVKWMAEANAHFAPLAEHISINSDHTWIE